MEKSEKEKLVERQKEIIEILNDYWENLSKDFYICYSVKELAYEIASRIIHKLGQTAIDFIIYYRFLNNKHKIIFMLEDNIFFQFDIYWVTGMFGDTGLKISNGKLTNKIPNCYEDIEDVLQDEEE